MPVVYSSPTDRMPIVYNSLTNQKFIYPGTPLMAVLAAYAEEQGDYDVDRYEEHYRHLLRQDSEYIYCGNYQVSHYGEKVKGIKRKN